MALFFTSLFLIATVGLALVIRRVVRERQASGHLSNKTKAALGFVAVLLVLLVIKFLVEELYPCLFVDRLYCDFTSTVY